MPAEATSSRASSSSSSAASACCDRPTTSATSSSPSVEGVPVLISDVAEVDTGFQQRQGMVGMDAKDDIVNGTILMRKGENPSVVLEGVKAKIDELNRSILPKGRRTGSLLRPRLADRQYAARRSSRIWPKARCWSAWCCSSSWDAFRPAAIVAVVIPLSLLATFIGLTIERHSRQSAFARRDGLRHHRGRRGDRGREHLPPRIARSSTSISSFKELVAEAAARWAGRRSSRC